MLDNGTKIVAAANGRPMIKNGMVVVVPLLLVPGNVDQVQEIYTLTEMLRLRAA